MIAPVVIGRFVHTALPKTTGVNVVVELINLTGSRESKSV